MAIPADKNNIDDADRHARLVDDLQCRTWDICKHLRRVTVNDDVAWSLSHAISCIRNGARSPCSVRPSVSDMRMMLEAVVAAWHGAMALLPRSYSREQVTLGFGALAGLVTWWAKSDTERASRHPHVAANMDAYAGALQRGLDDRVALEDGDLPAFERRAAVINELYLSAHRRKAA